MKVVFKLHGLKWTIKLIWKWGSKFALKIKELSHSMPIAPFYLEFEIFGPT